MRIGYPTIINIDAGNSDFQYIEVTEPNSIIYIGFALLEYDINFSFLKYRPNPLSQENKKLLQTIISVEKIKACKIPVKIIVLVPEPGVYKAIWDNSYSWLNSKKLRIRFSILTKTQISEISYDNNSKIVTSNSTNTVFKNSSDSNENIISDVNKSNDFSLKSSNKFQNSYEYIFNFKNFQKKVYFTSNNLRDDKNTVNIILHKDKIIYIRNYLMLDSFINCEKYSEKILDILRSNKSQNSMDYKILLTNEILKNYEICPIVDKLPYSNLTDYKCITLSFSESILYHCLLSEVDFQLDKFQIKNLMLLIIYPDKDPIVYLYQDKIIYENLKGLKYNYNSTKEENIENLINFISKSIMLFDDFNIKIFYFDYYTNINNISNDKRNNNEIEMTNIELFQNDESYMKDVEIKMRNEVESYKRLEKLISCKCKIKEGYQLIVLDPFKCIEIVKNCSNYISELIN